MNFSDVHAAFKENTEFLERDHVACAFKWGKYEF